MFLTLQCCLAVTDGVQCALHIGAQTSEDRKRTVRETGILLWASASPTEAGIQERWVLVL